MAEPFVCETGLVVESGCKVAVRAAANDSFSGTIRLRNPTEHALSYRLKSASPAPGLQARKADGCIPPGGAAQVDVTLSPAALAAVQLHLRIYERGQPGQKVPISFSRTEALHTPLDGATPVEDDERTPTKDANPSPAPSPLPSLVLSPLTHTPSGEMSCSERGPLADASPTADERATWTRETPIVGDERWLRETIGELLEEMARVCRSTDVRLTAATAPSDGGDGDAFTELLWRQVEKRLDGAPQPGAATDSLKFAVISETSFDV